MARETGPQCKLCRREGVQLFLKGARCHSVKCGVRKRDYPPGEHAWRRSRFSEYGLQLREKQKARRNYGILEKQFRIGFAHADRMKGVTGSNLLVLLERRLDNMVYRMGFARSRAEARQLVRHGHFTVNGKRVDIPSFLVRAEDVVEVREKSRKIAKIVEAIAKSDRSPRPAWLDVDKDHFKGKVSTLPARSDIAAEIDEQLIVELYSK